MKRWEASKRSPEAAFQTESSPRASEPVGEASPGIAKHHLLLQTFHTDFGVARWSPEWSLASKACSAPSPGHCRYGFPGIACNTTVSGRYPDFYKAQRIRRSSNKLFFILPYETWAISQQIKGNSLLMSLFFIGKPEKQKCLHFIFSLSARNVKELAGLDGALALVLLCLKVIFVPFL